MSLSGRAAPAYAVVAAVIGVTIGSRAPTVWLWPLVVVLAVYPVYASGVRSGKLGATFAWVVLWAAVLSVGTIVIMHPRVPEIGERILRGPAYAEEMLVWVRTGEGPEGDPRLYLPVHAGHFGAFALASALTGGFLGLGFGAVLLNYMNYYVAVLATEAANPTVAFAFGWPIWAILRVLGYIAVGVALGNLFFARILRRGVWDGPAFRRWMAIGVGLVVTDAVLKWLLAEPWRRLLLSGF
jgi:hypothetical protein